MAVSRLFNNTAFKARNPQASVESTALSILAVLLSAAPAEAADRKPRARDLGVPFDGTPGPPAQTVLAAGGARTGRGVDGCTVMGYAV